MSVIATSVAAFFLASLVCIDGTSIKMDFLPSGHVRTDPIISQTCLSDHVHTFYGANVLPYPDLTYDELVSVTDTDNTCNVKENKSLYWHPTVYSYDRNSGTYKRDEIAQTSSYYIWGNEDGRTTKAFREGFRMIAGTKGNTDTEFPNANAECVNASECERDDCSTENTFFPNEACAELEVSMFFPGCWDGVNLDSEDHMSHVAYSQDGEVDGECPSTHPVRIPIIAFFFRISNYDGGWHTFSDGSSIYHADYMSGWNEVFLQNVLNNCENDSFAPMPDAFCEEFVTFRDAPKCSDESCDFSDPKLLEKLQAIQPPLKDFKARISPEETLQIDKLPRGTCTGTLFPRESAPTSPPVANTPAPTKTQTESPTKSPIEPQTKSPTKSPIKPPTKSPTKECNQSRGTKFFLGLKRNNGEVVGAKERSCGWLANKKRRGKESKEQRKKVKRICRRQNGYVTLEPARDACKKTCGTCE